jgi:hypothetical protein
MLKLFVITLIAFCSLPANAWYEQKLDINSGQIILQRETDSYTDRIEPNGEHTFLFDLNNNDRVQLDNGNNTEGTRQPQLWP